MPADLARGIVVPARTCHCDRPAGRSSLDPRAAEKCISCEERGSRKELKPGVNAVSASREWSMKYLQSCVLCSRLEDRNGDKCCCEGMPKEICKGFEYQRNIHDI